MRDLGAIITFPHLFPVVGNGLICIEPKPRSGLLNLEAQLCLLEIHFHAAFPAQGKGIKTAFHGN